MTKMLEDLAEVVPGELDKTAPEIIWLQIDTSESNKERDELWLGDDGVTWCSESIGGLEIQYVRADLYTDMAKRLEAADALLRECDAVARMRGDKYGLCDEVDNYGNPYQSEYLEKHLQEPTDRRTPEGE